MASLKPGSPFFDVFETSPYSSPQKGGGVSLGTGFKLIPFFSSTAGIPNVAGPALQDEFCNNLTYFP